ncbi:molybdenum cofactor biosynthesis protein MoaE [Actinomyces faecalis]|uniref:molybdenum cofactor biosynthesis protein MoaE n=1 Tax=Actinomyces faecalis TaxID=2722820 RepID=UPI0015575E6A|nr:molybdenum cofactor biosynthesis protein MoaE [Actinomyces faecalis]
MDASRQATPEPTLTTPPPAARVVRAEVTEAPVSVDDLAAAVEDRGAGAVVTFDGMVRDHDGGRGVRAIAYSAHPTAGDVVAQVAAEVASRPGLRAVAVVHRVGDLEIGQTALGVAVSADHRAPAFDAVRDLVEEVKKRMPVWKHQLFVDGSREWSNIA